MKKYCIFFLVLLFGVVYGSSFYSVVKADDFSVDAKHAIAVEVTTGKILYEKDAQTKATIASLTKLLTVYLIFEAIDEGKLTLDTTVPISDYPYDLTSTTVSNVNLDARSYSVRDLLNASLITSANSATIALAEKIAGSEPAFVDKMKDKLTQWGISDAKLINVTGLSNQYLGDNIYPGSNANDENLLSAMDVAFIARRLILDYPEVLDITSQYSYNFGGTTYYSTNQMLPQGTYAREGVDGLKTGTSESSGSSFAATTTQDDMRIITVVLNADDSDSSVEKRFIETNKLMDYIYDNFSYTPLVEKGKQYQSSALEVFNGQESSSKAVAAKTLYAIIRKGADASVSAAFTATKTSIDAPVKKNDLLGTLALVDKDLIGTGYLEEQPSVDMVAAKNISAAPWPISWWNYFVRYVNENL